MLATGPTLSIFLIDAPSLTVGSGGAEKAGEEKGDLLTERVNQSMNSVFVEQPLVSPGSAKNYFRANISLSVK